MTSRLLAAMDRATRSDEDGRLPCKGCGRKTADPLGLCALCHGKDMAAMKGGGRSDSFRPLRITDRERNGR